jgi:hypothetical protein
VACKSGVRRGSAKKHNFGLSPTMSCIFYWQK